MGAAPSSTRVLAPTIRDDLVVHRLLGLVEVLDELADAALVLEGLLAASVALVGERDQEPRVQERELAQAAGEDVVLELGDGEDVVVGLERDLGAGLSVSPMTASGATGAPRRYSWK